jgi:hypothetical protein
MRMNLRMQAAMKHEPHGGLVDRHSRGKVSPTCESVRPDFRLKKPLGACSAAGTAENGALPQSFVFFCVQWLVVLKSKSGQ